MRFTRHAASLHTKLMVALAVLVTLMTGGSAYFLIEREGHRRLLELEERATRIADFLRATHPLRAWLDDHVGPTELPGR